MIKINVTDILLQCVQKVPIRSTPLQVTINFRQSSENPLSEDTGESPKGGKFWKGVYTGNRFLQLLVLVSLLLAVGSYGVAN